MMEFWDLMCVNILCVLIFVSALILVTRSELLSDSSRESIVIGMFTCLIGLIIMILPCDDPTDTNTASQSQATSSVSEVESSALESTNNIAEENFND